MHVLKQIIGKQNQSAVSLAVGQLYNYDFFLISLYLVHEWIYIDAYSFGGVV